MSYSPAEQFLLGFHDTRPGATSRAFGNLPAHLEGRPYASTYHILEDSVPQNSSPLEVLDLACGDGHLLSLLAARKQAGLTLTGVDMSAGELAQAREQLGSSGALYQARAQALPFADGTFHRVLCHMAFMLMDDVETVVREVGRVLKPGGLFAAVVGASPPPSEARSAYISAITRVSSQNRPGSIRIGDRRLRTRDGILQILGPVFARVEVLEIKILQYLTPAQLWAWFLEMYDLHGLSEAEVEEVQRTFLEALSSQGGPDRAWALPEVLWLIRGWPVGVLSEPAR